MRKIIHSISLLKGLATRAFPLAQHRLHTVLQLITRGGNKNIRRIVEI
jgi:hypothetical protein